MINIPSKYSVFIRSIKKFSSEVTFFPRTPLGRGQKKTQKKLFYCDPTETSNRLTLYDEVVCLPKKTNTYLLLF